jgi:MFS family permease
VTGFSTGQATARKHAGISWSQASSVPWLRLPILLLRNLTWVAVFLSLAFFFSEFTIGPMWAIPMDIAPRFSGSASGLMNTGSALAAIVSPLVFGYVIDKTGDWTLPFLGSIGLLLIGAMLAFWMKPDEELPGAALTVPLAAKETKTLKPSDMKPYLSSFILQPSDPI